jgi:hypothetical protein
MSRFFKNGGKIKTLIAVMGFVIGFGTAYNRSLLFCGNIVRDVRETKAWKAETVPQLTAMNENIIKICQALNIEPTRAKDVR